jgi:hypothetical protein
VDIVQCRDEKLHGLYREVHVTTMVIMRSLDVFVISGFRRDADEICALLGYYAARMIILHPLPFDAALYPRIAQIP